MDESTYINGFVIKELLYESKKSKVFKALDKDSNQQVVIKQLSNPFPTSQEIEHLLQEFDIASSLNSLEGISTYRLGKEGNSYYLIMDLFDGLPLQNSITEKRITDDKRLELSINLADILERIHDNKVIHKDINPSNILWNNLNGKVRIIDFGLSCRLSGEVSEILSPDHYDGTLSHISPEQTGRISATLDHRTDLYSLGITLYQLFTGELPFYGDDAMELVHSHIAKTPIAAHKKNREMPRVVSDIIMKLLAKNPDERYQSAKGLKSDLLKCLSGRDPNGVISPFELGKEDCSGKFRLTNKIYGREQELQTLNLSFENTFRGENELVLVSGVSGSGKSSLISEFQKQVIQQNGLFIKGKYERFRKDAPLSGFALAFNEFVEEILSSSAERVQQWKEKIKQIFGPNGKIITNLVPAMEQIIDRQPDLQQLNPTEAQNRLLMILENFIRSLASIDRPLVLFLDDIQWCDPLSLQLIKNIGAHEMPYVMLICAFRTDENHEKNLVKLTFNDIEKFRNFEKITLSNLTQESVNLLLSDTFHCNRQETDGLAQIIHAKTDGSPFFAKQLLTSLFKHKLVRFDSVQSRWIWNLKKIATFNIADNLFEIIRDRMQSLSNDTLEALEVASCFGIDFELNAIAGILNKSPFDVSKELIPALESGIIHASGNRVKIPDTQSQQMIHYRFQHYRIHQAIHKQMNPRKQQEIHFRIGQLLKPGELKNIPQEKLIAIANHLNYGLDLILDAEQKIELAGINLAAAEKAVSSSAYDSALPYFQTGIKLLPSNHWKDYYTLSFSLYKGFADCAYQTSNNKEAEQSTETLIRHAATNLDKASVYAMRLRQFSTMAKPEKAISEGIKALQMLGVKLSANPGPIKLLIEMGKAKMLQGKRKPEDLLQLPIMDHPEKKMIARILSEMGAPAYTLGNDILYGVLSLKVVTLSLRWGFTPELPYALVAYGMLQSIAFGNLSAGNKYGKLAIALNEKHNDLEYRCRVIAAYAVLTHHWNSHWSTLSEWFKKGIEAGVHSGDLFYLGHSASNCVIWDPTLNLQVKIREHKKYLSLVKETCVEDIIDTAEMRLQLLLNMRGETNNKFSLTDKNFDEEQRLLQMKNRNYVSGMAMYHLVKAEIYMMYHEPKKALAHIQEVDARINSLVGLNYTLILSVLAFHAASQCLKSSNHKKEYKNLLRRMHKEKKQMKKWASHNPGNYIHHYLLMQAEIFKHKGEKSKATEAYESAIKAANKNFWLKDEAFCNEIAADFYSNQGLTTAAMGYHNKALYLYRRLGAHTKVAHLKETYTIPVFELNPHEESQVNSIVSNTPSTTATINLLDFNSITKASQAISSEIVFETLLTKLMKITVENAGAQRGVLILADKKNLMIQAEFSVDDDKVGILKPVPLNNYTSLPKTMINYVSNTHKNITLGDAIHEDAYTQDPYISSEQPKSILVEPLLKQKKLHGILYLENKLNPGVFTQDRQNLIRVLSTQIAISIENSRLYEGLEDKIKERTAELLDANNQLSEKNKHIQHQNEALEKLNASKDKMFAIIAHDLKSPFNIILGASGLLSKNLDELSRPEIEKMTWNLHQSGLRVYGLLENLLNWARSQTGKIIFDPHPLLLKDMVTEVGEVLEENLNIKNLNIQTKVSDMLLIYADRQMLYTILRNLVSNAIKYSFPGGTIVINAENEIDFTKVSVSDNGKGMEQAQIEKLFNISQTVSTPGTNEEKGTGLGLLLCKEFIDKHGGSITVTSEPGKGCTIQFRLPNKK